MFQSFVGCIGLAIVFAIVGLMIRLFGTAAPTEQEAVDLKRMQNQIAQMESQLHETLEKGNEPAPQFMEERRAIQIRYNNTHNKFYKRRRAAYKTRDRANYWGFGPAVLFAVVGVAGCLATIGSVTRGKGR